MGGVRIRNQMFNSFCKFDTASLEGPNKAIIIILWAKASSRDPRLWGMVNLILKEPGARLSSKHV